MRTPTQELPSAETLAKAVGLRREIENLTGRLESLFTHADKAVKKTRRAYTRRKPKGRRRLTSEQRAAISKRMKATWRGARRAGRSSLAAK